MSVVVLGGSGEMGGRVVQRLRAAGLDARSASRATGVDVTTGAGLDAALDGAGCVIDCLNHQSVSRSQAVRFFAGAAERVSRAAEAAGVRHVVAVSIVGVTDPAVRGAVGYYAGKAVQEEVYARGFVPVSIVRTTAWFTLAETFLDRLRLGPVAVVPRIRLRPVHPDAAAELIVRVAEAGPTSAGNAAPAVHTLAGPEETDAASMARAVAAARHPGVRVLAVRAPGAALREGLLPGSEVPVDDRRFEDWVTGAGQ